MKKNLFFLPVILLTFLLSVTLFSCSKDEESLSPAAGSTAQTTPAGSPDEKFIMRGSIIGKVFPLYTEVKITVHSLHYITSSFYYTKDGGFRFDRIPPGIYKVFIFNPHTQTSYSFTDVKVTPGYVADIGIVKF